MKYCGNCGSQIDENSNVCPNCGNNVVGVNKEVKTISEEDNHAKNGFIFGLCGIAAWLLPLVGYPVTILAIYNSAKGLNSKTGHGKAVAGLVLGIIFLLLTLGNSIAGALNNVMVY